jgi:hypothetical protein
VGPAGGTSDGGDLVTVGVEPAIGEAGGGGGLAGGSPEGQKLAGSLVREWCGVQFISRWTLSWLISSSSQQVGTE